MKTEQQELSCPKTRVTEREKHRNPLTDNKQIHINVTKLLKERRKGTKKKFLKSRFKFDRKQHSIYTKKLKNTVRSTEEESRLCIPQASQGVCMRQEKQSAHTEERGGVKT